MIVIVYRSCDETSGRNRLRRTPYIPLQIHTQKYTTLELTPRTAPYIPPRALVVTLHDNIIIATSKIIQIKSTIHRCEPSELFHASSYVKDTIALIIDH